MTKGQRVFSEVFSSSLCVEDLFRAVGMIVRLLHRPADDILGKKWYPISWRSNIWLVASNIFWFFTLLRGHDPIWLIFFQMGWFNHQPAIISEILRAGFRLRPTNMTCTLFFNEWKHLMWVFSLFFCSFKPAKSTQIILRKPWWRTATLWNYFFPFWSFFFRFFECFYFVGFLGVLCAGSERFFFQYFPRLQNLLL